MFNVKQLPCSLVIHGPLGCTMHIYSHWTTLILISTLPVISHPPWSYCTTVDQLSVSSSFIPTSFIYPSKPTKTPQAVFSYYLTIAILWYASGLAPNFRLRYDYRRRAVSALQNPSHFVSEFKDLKSNLSRPLISVANLLKVCMRSICLPTFLLGF